MYEIKHGCQNILLIGIEPRTFCYAILEVVNWFITSPFPGILTDTVTMVIVSHMCN